MREWQTVGVGRDAEWFSDSSRMIHPITPSVYTQRSPGVSACQRPRSGPEIKRSGVDVTLLLLGCRSCRLTPIAEDEEEDEETERMRKPLEEGRKSEDKRSGGHTREAMGFLLPFHSNHTPLNLSLPSLTTFVHFSFCLIFQTNRHFEHKVAHRLELGSGGEAAREGRKEVRGSRSEDQRSGGAG